MKRLDDARWAVFARGIGLSSVQSRALDLEAALAPAIQRTTGTRSSTLEAGGPFKGGEIVGVLDGGIFHIEQISTKISTLSDAFARSDLMTVGLSLQSLSVAAHIARSQFTPADRTVALSWGNWITGLGFLNTCVAGVMDGDPDFVAMTNDLLSLSHEEYLHMLALAEEADRRIS